MEISIRNFIKYIIPVLIIISSVQLYTNEIEKAGDILQIVIPLSALFCTLGYQDYKSVGQLAASFSFTLATTYVFKYSIIRTRPDGGSWSFPSGHTSSAFSGSNIFMEKVWGKSWFYCNRSGSICWF